ncbi:MAG: hypothetical protein KAK01_07835, partial [Candidatus Marinimicrobia bacterium]|nr:hypothetical protein [Candidatus Neomarinimicrobiota bacterium]
MKRIRLFTILVLSTIIALSVLIAKPETLIRSEIDDKYKWDLTDIYADWDAWENDLSQVEALMDEYEAFKGRLGEGPDVLLAAYKLDDELGMLANRVHSYAMMSRDTD